MSKYADYEFQDIIKINQTLTIFYDQGRGDLKKLTGIYRGYQSFGTSTFLHLEGKKEMVSINIQGIVLIKP